MPLPFPSAVHATIQAWRRQHPTGKDMPILSKAHSRHLSDAECWVVCDDQGERVSLVDRNGGAILARNPSKKCSQGVTSTPTTRTSIKT